MNYYNKLSVTSIFSQPLKLIRSLSDIIDRQKHDSDNCEGP